MEKPIDYDFNNPLKTFNVAMDIFFPEHKEDKEEPEANKQEQLKKEK